MRSTHNSRKALVEITPLMDNFQTAANSSLLPDSDSSFREEFSKQARIGYIFSKKEENEPKYSAKKST